MTGMLVQRIALVDRPATHVFDVIERAEDYPQFLPWCSGATIVSRDAEEVRADIHVRWHGVQFDFRTRNPKRRPEHMEIHLERGPFRRFYGEWRLKQLGELGCRVEFRLDYEFDLGLVTRMAGPMFERIAGTLVDAFVARASVVPLQLEPPPAAEAGPQAAPASAAAVSAVAAADAAPAAPAEAPLSDAPASSPPAASGPAATTAGPPCPTASASE